MLQLDCFITDKVSDTLKKSQQTKSSCATLFCKTSQFSWKDICDEAQKGCHQHVFCKQILWLQFFWFISLKYPVRTCSSYNVGLLKSFGKLKENTSARVFFLDKVLFFRNPTVSTSNFNSTFLTFRPRKM